MSRPADRALEVELVEDDLAPLGTGEPDATGSRARWRPRLAAVPRWARVTAAVLALTGAGGVALEQHLERAAVDARLADVAGLSTSLARPLTEAWRAPAAGVLADVGDVVVLRDATREGVTAVALSDGRVRYTLEGSCRVVATDGDDDAPALPTFLVHGDPDDLLVCVRHAGGGGADPGSGTATAHVHAPLTGEPTRNIPLGPTTTWSVVGADVVSMGVEPGGHVVAGRWSLTTGAVEWSHRSPDVAPTGGDGWSSSMSDAVVSVGVGDWFLALDTATGAQVDRDPPDVGGGTWGPVDGPGGLTLEGRFSPDGTTRTTVRGPDGTRRFTTPGLVLTPSVDDGTAGGVVLVVEATDDPEDWTLLHAVDARTGTTRWTASVPVGQVLVLSGTVVVRDASGVTAVDAVTGRTRWTTSQRLPSVSGWDVVTDGRVLLTVEREQDRESLVARDIATGATAWTTPSPVPGGALTTLADGTLLLVGRTDVVALRS